MTVAMLCTVIASQAQVQWFQDQDSHAPFPYGTYSTRTEPLNATSFLACYQWKAEGDQYTWKLSKTDISGQEIKTFFRTASNSVVDFHAGHRNAVYVFEKDFPNGQAFRYNVYKLDTNLVLLSQTSLNFPAGFSVFNLNVFEIDEADNLYFAGDGQYPDGPGFSPASFVMKTDRQLQTKWTRMDSVQAAYTRLHIDSRGNVIVLDDNPDLFPGIHLREWSESGQLRRNYIVAGEASRQSLFSMLDRNDNLYLYGNYDHSDTAQAIFLYRVNRLNGQTLYRRSLFESRAVYPVDFRMDHHGNLFTLVQQYDSHNEQSSKVSRINAGNGAVSWNRNFPYRRDSTSLSRIVVGNDEQFYVMGQRTRYNIFISTFVQKLRKNGHTDGNFDAPDSSRFSRMHWLTDGFTDRNNQLIAIGTTQDYDSLTFGSTYLRAFALRYGGRRGCQPGEAQPADAALTDLTAETASTTFAVYPNPAQDVIHISGIKTGEYDQLQVVNMSGAVVLRQTLGNSTAQINVASLADGVYLLVLRSASGLPARTSRVVIRK